MANERAIEEIMAGIGPTKSGARYDSAWEGFLEFLGKGEGEESSIREDDFIRYLVWARDEKKWASSTLWTMYSRLNNVFKRKTGIDAKNFMRLKMLLKSYNEGYERTAAKTFSKAEIIAGLQLPCLLYTSPSPRDRG